MALPLPGSASYAARIAFLVELAEHLHLYGTTSQRLEGARFLQELRITGLRTADPEDLLETFTLLMIHRGVHELRAGLPQTALRGPAYVPAWFATGCAQNLHRTTRARNRAVVLRAFEAGGGLKTTHYAAPAQRSRGGMVKDAAELVAKLKEKGLL